jgi:hypothetical protein
MSRRPARCTEAEYARAIRAAQKTGAGQVRVLTDGTICIDVQATTAREQPENAVDDDGDIVL